MNHWEGLVGIYGLHFVGFSQMILYERILKIILGDLRNSILCLVLLFLQYTNKQCWQCTCFWSMCYLCPTLRIHKWPSFYRMNSRETDSWTRDVLTNRGMHVTFHFLLCECGREKWVRKNERARERRERQRAGHRNCAKRRYIPVLSCGFHCQWCKLSHRSQWYHTHGMVFLNSAFQHLQKF